MRVLFVTPADGYGGAEKYLYWIAQGAMGRGWEVTLACNRCAALTRLVSECQLLGMHVGQWALGEDLPCVFLGRAAVVKATLRYVPMLLTYRPDVVHVSLPQPVMGAGIVFAAALLRIPAVVAFQFAAEPYELSDRMRRWYQWARNRRQIWIAVSQHNRRMLCKTFGCDASEIQVVYNGSVVTRDAAKGRSANGWTRSAVRRAMGVSDHAFLLSAVGRLCHQKGLDVLIKSLARVVAEVGRDRNVCVVIVGEGPQKQRLETLAKSVGVGDRVVFAGYRDDVPALVAASDAFVFPSRYEGAPFAMLEAMGLGVPVIATRFGGAGEFIQDGVNGMLVDVDDDVSLAKALVWAVHHPEALAVLGRKGCETASQFDGRRMVGTTLSLLQQVAGRA